MSLYGLTRHHVTLGPKRTTVTLDKTLSILLSLQLGHTPGTPQAKNAVRLWLQARIDQSGDYCRGLISHWLQEKVIFALVSRELDGRYVDWLCSTPATFTATVAPPRDTPAAVAEVVKPALANIPKNR